MSDDPAAVDESDREPTESADDRADAVANDEVDAAGTDREATADDERADRGEPSVETLVSRIASHDEALAQAAHELGDRIEALEAELDARDEEIEAKDEQIAELTEKLSRSRADFKNYKKRTQAQQAEMQARATEDLVERLTSVRDNLVRALDQEEGADIRPGVDSTLESFDRVLEDENVTFITPTPGDEVDPERHEVMLRVDSDHPDGTIADVYQPGYEMAGKVLRPAQVTVSSDDA